LQILIVPGTLADQHERRGRAPAIDDDVGAGVTELAPATVVRAQAGVEIGVRLRRENLIVGGIEEVVLHGCGIVYARTIRLSTGLARRRRLL